MLMVGQKLDSKVSDAVGVGDVVDDVGVGDVGGSFRCRTADTGLYWVGHRINKTLKNENRTWMIVKI